MNTSILVDNEEPLGAELFSLSQLDEHARALAGRHVVGHTRRRGRLLARLDENEVALRQAYAQVSEAVASGRRITPAAEWLIDNFHLVEEQVRAARLHLPKRYSHELPRLVTGPAAGMPRVYDLAIEFISHSHGRVDTENLGTFVAAFQTVSPLGLGELWAVPIMLRLALLENLRRVVANVTAGLRDRDAARMWAARLLEGSAEPATAVLVLGELVKADPPLSPPFVVELATKLRGQAPVLAFPLSWLEQCLVGRGQTIEHMYQVVSKSQAADQVAIGNTIGSLRLVTTTDWRDFVEASCVVERALTKDPADVYAAMDFDTRDRYRHVVEAVSRRTHTGELEVAEAAVELARSSTGPRARHVGYYLLVPEGRARLEETLGAGEDIRASFERLTRRLRRVAYGSAVAGLTAGLAAVVLFAAAQALGWLMLLALVIPVVLVSSQLAVALVHGAVSRLAPPHRLPRLDFSSAIPPEHRTLVAIPAMLTDAAEIDALLESLEVHQLANSDPELAFALVTDFRDAEHETMEGDEALLRRARERVQSLNARHPGRAPFHLLHRPRRWNEHEGVWMGWERKRGKLEQLNDALRGDASGFHTQVGDADFLREVRYVITLDADTYLPRDAARELAGAMGHPLNRPRFDATKGRVTEGHGILQPRLATTLTSLGSSRFARLHGGEPGIDPYTRAVSDVYQDAFGEGSFVGKGIYHVDVLREATRGRLPENRVLSHDLIEGALARAGLVSDVMLLEDQPSAYAADVARRVRWVRGDWQVAAWLGRSVPGGDGGTIANPLSWLSRWKIFDNLRRSLVPLALLALLLVGWTTPGLTGLLTALVVSVLLIPGLIAASLTRRPGQVSWYRHARELAGAFGTQLLREGFALACLPHAALLNGVAIARTGVRLLTRRKLLEWRTAADAQRSARPSLVEVYRAMWIAPVTAIAAGVAVTAAHPWAWLVAAPVTVLWVLAPALTWWVSQPLAPAAHHLEASDVAFLRKVARRTWRFFEVFVGAADRHLPPDNFQEDPPQGIAHRTSPTNIGVAMTSTLAAYDFGYVSVATVIERITRTLDSLDELPRHRGHFYNWYDTQTLEPLRPFYVSTVDSGNLAGHLLTLSAGLEQLADQPVFRPQVVAGLADTLAVCVETGATGLSDELSRLEQHARGQSWTLSGARDWLEQLAEGRQGRLAAVPPEDEEAAWWARAFEHEVRSARDELTWIAPWMLEVEGERPEIAARLDRPVSLAEVAALAGQLAPALEADGVSGPFLQAVRLASSRAAARIDELCALALRCTELAQMDHDFLYDPDRHLMAIGYNVTEHRRDAGFYDLLASEARLASFVAIAQGKLPQEHWFSLGRLLTDTAGHPALLSWSGSMFEYLMPLLVMPSYPGTMLDQTYRGVVERQIEYGRARKVPWGVSESGYNKTDAQLNYQYRAFGVPGLGFKRGLADDLVVAPYASAMALMIDPRRSCQNLRRLDDEERRGPYGFYEAVDYTPSRLPPGQNAVTVRSYMAHHQGMTLLSLAYVLLDQPMQRRFGSLPAFRATSLLLQERVQRTPPIYPHPAEVSAAGEAVDAAGASQRVYATSHTRSPAVKLLSNGSYHVAVTNAGGGYSRWRELAVTRWREDPTRDSWGSFCYVRDLTEGRFWSMTHQPTLVEGAGYEAVFSLGRAEFRRRDGDLDALLEISVSPEDDVELRRVSITNMGRTARTIELTSYAEVVLTSPRADDAHPAFSSLFVQTELVRARGAILCTRRPRSGTERPPWMLHLMMVHGTRAGETSYETSRASFLGRGRDAADPAAMHRPLLENTEGAVLDPVVAIRNTLTIEPDETARVHLVTGVAETREGALGLIGKYSERHSAARVFELAWTHDQVLLRRQDVTEAETQLYERLASNLLYSTAAMRAPSSVIARNRSGQSALWPHSISGDLPIALARVTDVENLGIVRQMVQAHAYWRQKGVAADLVIWNEDPSGYRQVLQDKIHGLVGGLGDSGLLDQPGGIFVRRSEQLSEEDRTLLQTVARVIVTDSGGTLAEQLDRRPPVEAPGVAFRATRVAAPSPVVQTTIEPPELAAWNGLGGFTPDGREYVIRSGHGVRTPAPWVNVLANPYFGTVVSESGSAYTWCENAHGHRLTPWSNDAVSDASGEVYYVRDEETGRYWSPTPLPAGGPQPYTTRHGFGYTAFEYEEGGLASELETYVAVDAPVKFMIFRLKNDSGRARRLSLTALYELVLGTHRAANSPHVVSEVDPSSGAIFARNAYSGEFGSRVAFLDCSIEPRTLSGDRLELIGRNGTLAHPQCMRRAHLSGRIGAALDPCLAMQGVIELRDGEEREVAFTFGSGRDLDDARTLVHRFRGVGAARSALEAVWAYYNRTLGTVNVRTPDPTLDFLANGWLLQQVLAARLWGRSGFYQSGGAFGFRDQLQDAMALVHAEPALLREQILRAASRQFREGDVQHWWHPPAGRGVRTRISDDYLFLPCAVSRYVEAIGDTGLLDERVPFIEGRSVDAGEDSYYDLPQESDESGTLYEHCVRAIEHGLRFGVHGLPLMGTGDWNDGMNLVGDEGKGESVWLAFFLHDVLERFAGLAEARGDFSFAETCREEATHLRSNLERHGWDGEWYRRAYFDDGTPLGSASNPECQIDSLPQSWAVLSGAAPPERARLALASLDRRLVRRDLGLIQLFDPPFDTSPLEPGYVKGYVPGVRENGGQYTHAAVWAVMAFAAVGDAARAWELFGMINPVRHGDSPEAIATYKVEPYVVAADIYANPQHAGRGGWTWYTGSAAWMYRLVLESLLGVTREVDRLRVAPLMPLSWDGFDIHYRHHDTVHHIHVTRHRGGGGHVSRVSADGVERPDGTIPLQNDGVEHYAVVEIGAPSASEELPAGPDPR